MPTKVKLPQLQKRSQELTSLNRQRALVVQINNEETRAILNNRFANLESLTRFRSNQDARIRQVNAEYTRSVEGVLNDKALDFLVQHSNIDVPTLTSIFAGFELARASRADRSREARDIEIARLQAQTDRQTEQVKLNETRSAAEQQQLQAELTNNISQLEVLTKQGEADVSDANALIVDEFNQNQALETAGNNNTALNTRNTATNASRERVAALRNDGKNEDNLSAFDAALDGIIEENKKGSSITPIRGGNGTPTTTDDDPLTPAPVIDPARGQSLQQETPIIDQTLLEENEALEDANADLTSQIEEAPLTQEQLLTNRDDLLSAINADPLNDRLQQSLANIDGQLDLDEQQQQTSADALALNTLALTSQADPENQETIAALDDLTIRAGERLQESSVAFREAQTLDQERTINQNEVARLNNELRSITNNLASGNFSEQEQQGIITRQAQLQQQIAALQELA